MIYSNDEFETLRSLEGPGEDFDENRVGVVLRLASEEDRGQLPTKYKKEQPLLRICQAFVSLHKIPMSIYGVEYQFDGRVVYVYYVSKDRVDFRPLVKYLVKKHCQGVRVQMKKTTQCRPFVPVPFATEALISGKYCR